MATAPKSPAKKAAKSASPNRAEAAAKTSPKSAAKESPRPAAKAAAGKQKAAPVPLPPASDVDPRSLVGKKAPELDLEGPAGRVRLADFAGASVVLYFYPKDDTPGCTLEAKDFEAARAAFARKNAVVVGVSRDSMATHARFAKKHGLSFALLSDPDARVLSAYGAWAEKVLYGHRGVGIVRSTFVIDGAGKVVAAFPKVKVAGHVDAVLAALP